MDDAMDDYPRRLGCGTRVFIKYAIDGYQM